MNGLFAVLIVGALLGVAGMRVFGVKDLLVRIYNDRKNVAGRR